MGHNARSGRSITVVEKKYKIPTMFSSCFAGSLRACVIVCVILQFRVSWQPPDRQLDMIPN